MQFRLRAAAVGCLVFAVGPMVAACSAELHRASKPPIDAKDWPMYNCDVLGSRYNAGETALSPETVGRLVEKWRFPASDSARSIGAIHGTPVVVGGCVYFGTVNKATFYKLNPDGTVKWSFPLNLKDDRVLDRFSNGIFGSALVAGGSVYFATVAGFVYALDRDTGKEKWRLDMRSTTFPGAHEMNGTFASPILADGKLVVAGGAQEQAMPRFMPRYQGWSGRGFVMALEPDSGRIAWKYDVGPKPVRLDPPVMIKDSMGAHLFRMGPASSSVWSTPSYHEESRTLFFGTDASNAPRQPTKDDPRLDTPYACAVIALDARTGAEKWVTQINPGDVWNAGMRGYDPDTKQYKDMSIGDTPKIATIAWKGAATRVVGFGCKNGGFYIARASDGAILAHTPLYQGEPTDPPEPPPEQRTLALPGLIGGLQTGCASDGKRVYTNGVDAIRLGTQASPRQGGAPTAGRAVAISLDTTVEYWRHERPKVASVGGPPPRPVLKNVGDPVASGLAVAGGVVYFTTLMSSKLVALDAATGKALNEIQLPPVWCGPSVSRGRVYVGSGNMVMPDAAVFGPSQATGTLFCFGLPGADEVSRLAERHE
jgi:polyvinyl alcohol dehydrogenase (cytochrome)